MKTVRLVATNTIAQLVGKAATIFSTVLIGRLITSESGLGKDGFNDYAIIVAYAAYFYIITDFGLNAIAAKDIAENESQSSRYLSNLLTMRLVISVGLVMLGLAILAFIPEYSNTIKLGAILFLVTIFFQAIFTNGNVLFQARMRYFQSAIAMVSGAATSLGLAYLVYVSGGGLFAYIIASIVGLGVMAVVSLIQVGNLVRLKLAVDRKLWQYLIMAALPLGMTIVFNLLYIRSGFFVISVADESNYGLYTLAYRVFDGVLVLPVFLVNSLFPIMVKKLRESQAVFRHFFVKSLLATLAVSLLIAGAVWVLAPLAIYISSDNPAFEPSIGVLRWLSLLIPLFFVSNTLLWATITLGKRYSLVIFYAIAAVVSVSLNIWLIPQYGYLSAILVTGLAELIIVVLMGAQLWQLLRSGGKPSEPAIGESDVELGSVSQA